LPACPHARWSVNRTALGGQTAGAPGHEVGEGPGRRVRRRAPRPGPGRSRQAVSHGVL